MGHDTHLPKSGVMATPGIHDRNWHDPTMQADKDGIVSRRPPPAAGNQNTEDPVTVPMAPGNGHTPG